MGQRGAIATIVIAELFCTSLWFSSNGAAADLQNTLNLSASGIGWLTNAVQLGFIAGTLLAATTGLADRYPASRIFFWSGVVGAAANAVFALYAGTFEMALALRFIVGLSLAGIYPLGMKLVIGWSRANSSATLALLVAMLTLGTALPHALRGALDAQAWRWAVLASSVLTVTGGLMVARLGDGPFLPARQPAPPGFAPGKALLSFRIPAFRGAAFGYFGHMWELYAFWTLVPYLLVHALPNASAATRSLLAFAVIAIGALGCLAGGWLSGRMGSARVAFGALAASGTICALYPALGAASGIAAVCLLLAWGFFVVADSPQFSSLSGRACPPQEVGSALAMQNAIGFSITIVSIWMATSLFPQLGLAVCWLLVPGPVLGLIGMRGLVSAPRNPGSPG
jgi:predicted MFS family arabinose efflux permease